jgi:hypothetical protein
LEDGASEAALVLGVVAALSCAASPLLGFCSVGVTLPVLCELGTSRVRADAPALGLGHGDPRSVRCRDWGVVSVKASATLGVFVVGLAVFMVGVAREFTMVWLVIGGLLMLGAVAATAGRRRTGPDPEVTLRPGGERRPWRGPRG